MAKVILAHHLNSQRRYLFAADRIPDGEQIQKGEDLLVDTRCGKAFAKALTGIIDIPDADLGEIALLTGATLPLRQVLGRVTTEYFPEPDADSDETPGLKNQPQSDRQPEDPDLTLEKALHVVLPESCYFAGHSVRDAEKFHSDFIDWLFKNYHAHTLLRQAVEMVVKSRDDLPF